jgi:uncharacterized glyoxalase superfamily protein PhnB
MSDHPTVFPALRYRDPRAALDFLVAAFGAEKHAVYANDDGAIVHAEVRFGNGMVMFGGGDAAGGEVYVVVDAPDALCERARAAGAEITREPNDTDYGSREFGAKDLEGNSWSFGTYQPFDVPPQA